MLWPCCWAWMVCRVRRRGTRVPKRPGRRPQDRGVLRAGRLMHPGRAAAAWGLAHPRPLEVMQRQKATAGGREARATVRLRVPPPNLCTRGKLCARGAPGLKQAPQGLKRIRFHLRGVFRLRINCTLRVVDA